MGAKVRGVVQTAPQLQPRDYLARDEMKMGMRARFSAQDYL